MRDRAANWAAIWITTLFLPYCFTMILSGSYVDRQEKERSGISLIDQQGKQIDMEEFLPYMIGGEINLDYEEETLKAQAVIARTNLIKALDGKKEEKIENLSLEYLTQADFENSFGEKKRARILNQLQQAVRDTKGEVLTWNHNYIEAVYHQVSIGMTVSAQEMYGKEIPYLISVDSSQDVESEEYMTIKEIQKSEALSLLKSKNKGKDLTEKNLMDQLKIEEKTDSGFVKKVTVGKDRMTGEEWKELFSLPSSNFYLEEYEGKVRMIVLGQGHSMGMSQYGANEMAKEKKSYVDILSWYYPGTKITKVESE